jgi:hypothetical protein
VGGEGVGAGGWGLGTSRVATDKNAKITRYTQSHRVLGMKTWLKLNCVKKFLKRARTKLPITTKNVKISKLEKELELPKFQLKSYTPL